MLERYLRPTYKKIRQFDLSPTFLHSSCSFLCQSSSPFCLFFIPLPLPSQSPYLPKRVVPKSPFCLSPCFPASLYVSLPVSLWTFSLPRSYLFCVGSIAQKVGQIFCFPQTILRTATQNRCGLFDSDALTPTHNRKQGRPATMIGCDLDSEMSLPTTHKKLCMPVPVCVRPCLNLDFN